MGKEKHRDHPLGTNETERLFASIVLRIGLIAEPSPSIRCDHPVPNKNGNPVKTVTTPDFIVTDPETARTMYVEVTHGNGDLPSKDAQRRVVEEAGIENYSLLTGNQIQALLDAPTKEAARVQLFNLFGWSTSSQ